MHWKLSANGSQTIVSSLQFTIVYFLILVGGSGYYIWFHIFLMSVICIKKQKSYLRHNNASVVCKANLLLSTYLDALYTELDQDTGRYLAILYRYRPIFWF